MFQTFQHPDVTLTRQSRSLSVVGGKTWSAVMHVNSDKGRTYSVLAETIYSTFVLQIAIMEHFGCAFKYNVSAFAFALHHINELQLEKGNRSWCKWMGNWGVKFFYFFFLPPSRGEEQLYSRCLTMTCVRHRKKFSWRNIISAFWLPLLVLLGSVGEKLIGNCRVVKGVSFLTFNSSHSSQCESKSVCL